MSGQRAKDTHREGDRCRGPKSKLFVQSSCKAKGLGLEEEPKSRTRRWRPQNHKGWLEQGRREEEQGKDVVISPSCGE